MSEAAVTLTKDETIRRQADEIERLRKQVLDDDTRIADTEIVRKRDAEIERLRGHINWLNDANDGGRLAIDEIERLRDSVCRITEQAATYSAEIERLRGLLDHGVECLRAAGEENKRLCSDVAYERSIRESLEQARSEDLEAIKRLRGENDALKDEVELKAAALTGTSRVMGEEIERLRELLGLGEIGAKALADAKEEIERLRDYIKQARAAPGADRAAAGAGR